VTNEIEAINLLTAVRPVFESVGYQVESLIWNSSDDNGSWNINGDVTSIPGLKVTSRGSETYTANPPNFMDDDWEPAAGQSLQMSESSDTTVELTTDKVASEVVIYQGSTVTQKENETGSLSITAISGSGATIRASMSENDSDQYALTASYTGKGGKIILNARRTASISNQTYNITSLDDFPEPPFTYSGSLTVYGADDAEVFTVLINSEATYYLAMNYFD
jgi:hypothetical protein